MAPRTVLIAIVFLFPVLSAADEAPGAATGKRIGTAISTAIGTAFPAVKTVLDAIWPDPSKKKSADEAKAKLDEEKKKADAKRNENMRALKGAAEDLALARIYITNSVVASQQLAAMIALLNAKPALSDEDYLALGDRWNEVEGRIKELKSADLDKKLESVSDLALRERLQAVRDANYGDLSSIGGQIKVKRADALRRTLPELQAKTSAVTALGGLLLGSLSRAVSQTASELGGMKEGGGEVARAAKRSRQDEQDNLRILDSAFRIRR